jgi:5-methylcytosine-specific restriction endonuclease McrA
MLVYVLNKKRIPLMPCTPAKARALLKEGKAKVLRREPFTILLRFGSSGYRQEVVAGMDTGSETLGCAAVGNDQVLYQSEVAIRQDVTRKLKQRANYRRTRRSRKTRYRPARWRNRASMRKDGRLVPSLFSKVQSHLRERRFVESILPVTRWKVELTSFDIHKITDPSVQGTEYQQGDQKDYYNTKAYVLHRDGYRCKSRQKGVQHSKKLHAHHIVFRTHGGSDAPSNLITLCESCHDALHAGVFKLHRAGSRSRTKHATQIGIIKASLLKVWDVEPVFGYETKFRREQNLHWPKSHFADAVAICCHDTQSLKPEPCLYRKRHIAKGDYQQTSGKRSEKRIPTGKLFKFRKFDLIKTSAGRGFVKGKRSSGRFSISELDGTVIHPSVNVRNAVRISARTSTLINRTHSSHG